MQGVENNKLSKYLSKKLRHLLTIKAALLIYKNMILPILEYGDIFTMAASQENRKKLQTLQNKALRCALNKDRRYSTKDLHAEAKLSKLKLRRKLHLLLHMHKCSHQPNYKNWKKRALITTRHNSKKLIKIKKPNFTKFKRSITYQGPKQWNTLPKEIQVATDYFSFKTQIINHLTKSSVNKGK